MKDSKEVNVFLSLCEDEAIIFTIMCYDRIRVLSECHVDTESIQAYARAIERINQEIVKNKVKDPE